jgi:DNA-binding NarL/FixJ family response regulator
MQHSVHLIEAQWLFVPTLADIFRELDLELRSVSSDLDRERLLRDQPSLVFIDSDFLSGEPLGVINLARTLVPEGIICVYTGERKREWAKACHFAGATAVFSKHADRGEILTGLRRAIRRQPYTDTHLRPLD